MFSHSYVNVWIIAYLYVPRSPNLPVIICLYVLPRSRRYCRKIKKYSTLSYCRETMCLTWIANTILKIGRCTQYLWQLYVENRPGKEFEFLHTIMMITIHLPARVGIQHSRLIMQGSEFDNKIVPSWLAQGVEWVILCQPFPTDNYRVPTMGHVQASRHRISPWPIQVGHAGSMSGWLAFRPDSEYEPAFKKGFDRLTWAWFHFGADGGLDL